MQDLTPDLQALSSAPVGHTLRRSRPDVVAECRVQTSCDDAFDDEVGRQCQHMPSPPRSLLIGNSP